MSAGAFQLWMIVSHLWLVTTWGWERWAWRKINNTTGGFKSTAWRGRRRWICLCWDETDPDALCQLNRYMNKWKWQKGRLINFLAIFQIFDRFLRRYLFFFSSSSGFVSPIIKLQKYLPTKLCPFHSHNKCS